MWEYLLLVVILFSSSLITASLVLQDRRHNTSVNNHIITESQFKAHEHNIPQDVHLADDGIKLYEKYSLLKNVDFNFQFLDEMLSSKDKRTSIKINPLFTYQHLNEQWCKHFQTYPEEPDILLYPRMPKCGSSTLEELISTLAKVNNFTAIRSPPQLWKNFDINTTARSEFINLVNASIQKHKQRVVIDGHFEQITFEPHEMLAFNYNRLKNGAINKHRRHVESMQFVRDCVNRSTSLFFYELFDSSAGQQAKASGTVKEHILQSLHIPLKSKAAETFRFEECLEDYHCVRGYPFEAYNRNGLPQVCGTECIKQVTAHTQPSDEAKQGSKHDPTKSIQVKGAIFNAIHPDFFTVIGTLDYMDEYFEMLECAYPTIFRGITDYYRNEHVHVKTGSASIHYHHSDALMKVVTESCEPTTSDAGYFYEKLLPYFRSRYQYMKANRERCCRRAKQ
jgi:hypothetical protein